jgi:predicted nucleic acid-binding protein
MIILDTDVLSAAMRRAADAAVIAWLDRQPAESLWLTAIAVFEVRFGLRLLPEGRRRRALEEAFEGAGAPVRRQLGAIHAGWKLRDTRGRGVAGVALMSPPLCAGGTVRSPKPDFLAAPPRLAYPRR